MVRLYRVMTGKGSIEQVLDLKMEKTYKKKKDTLLKSEILRFNDTSFHEKLKPIGGVYRVFLARNPKKTLYVGKAKSIRQRLYNNLLMGQIRSHTLKRKLIRQNKCIDQETAKAYLKRNCAVQYIEEENGKERSFLEHYTISMLRPGLND